MLSNEKLVFVEEMNGFENAISFLSKGNMGLISGKLSDLLTQTNTNIKGIVKGPRTILDMATLNVLALKYPSVVISYIGRHIDKILADDVRFKKYAEGTHLVETNYGPVIFKSMESSPLSKSVASYVITMCVHILSGETQKIANLTIPNGNSFEKRSGHDFSFQNSHELIKKFRGKTVVVFGAGDIGSQVIEFFLQNESRVNFVSPIIKEFKAEKNFACHYNSFSELLCSMEHIDILSVHLPANVFVPLREIQNVTVFINTSSGTNINEHDLIHALIDERIKIAVLDVFSNEKNFSQSIFNTKIISSDTSEQKRIKKTLQKFIKQGRLILTPHIAYLENSAMIQTLGKAIKAVE